MAPAAFTRRNGFAKIPDMGIPSLEETIVAVSTPPGAGGIGVVRLSGDRSLEIVRTFFRPRRALRKIPARRAVFGLLREPDSGAPFDEAILTYFQGPASYTGEDVVEVSCHGSPAVLEAVVRLAVRQGARLAHPGEFTRRAFLRGRIDILQAEAVNDLVRAESFETARLAFRTVEGRLSRRVAGLRDGAVRIIAGLEAAIEFPDEDLSLDRKRLAAEMEETSAVLEKLIESYEAGRAMARGANLAILGRRNVGKSTLFNALLGEPRAIVTPRPGTTRDYLREKIKIGEASFHLIDTAGIGLSGSEVEREGMRRGRKLASQADGILFVIDGSKGDPARDAALAERYRDKKIIFVVNKIDKIGRRPRSLPADRFSGRPSLEVSALKGTNIERLRHLIHEMFAPKSGPDEEVIFHLRDKVLLEEALAGLRRAKRMLENGHSEEVVAEEIRVMLGAVGRLTGEIRTDEVMDRIFSRFCVGK